MFVFFVYSFISLTAAFPAAAQVFAEQHRPDEENQAGYYNPIKNDYVSVPLSSEDYGIDPKDIVKQTHQDPMYNPFNEPYPYASSLQNQESGPQPHRLQQFNSMLLNIGGLTQSKLSQLVQSKASMWEKLPNMLPRNPVIDTTGKAKRFNSLLLDPTIMFIS